MVSQGARDAWPHRGATYFASRGSSNTQLNADAPGFSSDSFHPLLPSLWSLRESEEVERGVAMPSSATGVAIVLIQGVECGGGNVGVGGERRGEVRKKEEKDVESKLSEVVPSPEI